MTGDAVRVDRWLWSVRVFKTRTLATDACRAGHVAVNRAVTKASTSVRVGDEVTVRHGGRDRVFEVVRLIENRVGAPIAAECLIDRSPPALVDGRRLSDPSLDWAWAAFVDHGITPVFHVADQPRPFADAWYGEEIPGGVTPLSSIFIWTGVALALTDLIIHGVLERHPDLRLGVMELSAIWVPLHLQMMDGGFAFASSFNGEQVPLSLRPSDYFRRQVRVAAFSYERPRQLTDRVGDIFMACSDYPHTEGTDTALEDYRQAGMVPGEAPGFFSGNIDFLLRS